MEAEIARCAMRGFITGSIMVLSDVELESWHELASVGQFLAVGLLVSLLVYPSCIPTDDGSRR